MAVGEADVYRCEDGIYVARFSNRRDDTYCERPETIKAKLDNGVQLSQAEGYIARAMIGD